MSQHEPVAIAFLASSFKYSRITSRRQSPARPSWTNLMWWRKHSDIYPQVTIKMCWNSKNLCTCLQLLWNSLRILTCCSLELSDLHQKRHAGDHSHGRKLPLHMDAHLSLHGQILEPSVQDLVGSLLWWLCPHLFDQHPFQRLTYIPSLEHGHCASSQEFVFVVWCHFLTMVSTAPLVQINCVTLFGCPPCLWRSAYGNELHWTIKLISKKRVITYIGTYGQSGKCCYKNR